MAKIHPDLQSWRPRGAGQYAERAVLEQLRDGLAPGFDIFHSVDLSAVHAGVQGFGEIDVVVVNSQGHLLLIEVKAGELEEMTPPHSTGQAVTHSDAAFYSLSKRYGNHSKDVIAQSNGQLKAMRQRLHNEGFEGFKVAQLVVLPGHTLKTAPAGLPRERIVDASQISELCGHVVKLIDQGQGEHANPDAGRSRLLNFLQNQFQLVPDPTARIGVLNDAVTRLGDGLATWVPRIHSQAGQYVVEATAGSGKTQLALRMLRDACAKGQRCMYVCYNRPLADHIIRVAPSAALVSTVHELAIDHLRSKHASVDFSEAGIFDRAMSELIADSLSDDALQEGALPDDALNTGSTGRTALQRARLDLLVIDEMQDMKPDWIQVLASRLKPDGRIYLLGDSQQAIYDDRELFELPGAVLITCNENFRTPVRIVESINLLGLTDEKIEARCPEQGQVPDIRSYTASDSGGLRAVQKTIEELLNRGVDASQIAVVTFAGLERSQVLRSDTLAGLPVRKFTKRFDTASNPIWTAGALLVETLSRFKGQAAPYVILCEVDFHQLDDKQRRKLFVGMTRAQLGLTVIMSEDAEAALTRFLLDK